MATPLAHFWQKCSRRFVAENAQIERRVQDAIKEIILIGANWSRSKIQRFLRPINIKGKWARGLAQKKARLKRSPVRG